MMINEDTLFKRNLRTMPKDTFNIIQNTTGNKFCIMYILIYLISLQPIDLLMINNLTRDERISLNEIYRGHIQEY